MLASLTILAVAEATAETGGISELLGTFGVDVRVIIAQALNFIVVGAILWFFAFKPVMSTLETRQHKIAEGLQFADDAKQQLAEAEMQKAEILRQANTESQQILLTARDKAKAFEEKMRAETSVQIEEMRKRAEAANEMERQKMISEVKNEIARLVVLTSARVLQTELNDDEKNRLNQAATREVAKFN